MHIAKFLHGTVLIAATMAVLSRATASFYYVAPNGSDSNPGTLNRPFESLSRAQQAARQARGTEPVQVYLREGIYYLPQPLVFTPEDSGTKKAHTIYQAYQKEKAVISGGVPLK